MSAERIEEVESQARQERERLLDHLSAGQLAETNELFTKLKGNNLYDPPWHRVVGAWSVRKMAVDLGRVAEYDYFYSSASTVMHGSSYRHHFRIQGGAASLSNIRWPDGIETIFRIIIATTCHTYRTILEKYRPHEESQYAGKYVEDSQAALVNVKTPSVEFGLKDK